MSIRYPVTRAAIAVVLLLGLLGGLALAQDNTNTVTDDDVNAVAEQLFCPVCENIPLDVCGTAACADWRNEIRIQLEAGKTQQEIIDDFVARFGDRVVGTPQDPVLRTLSLVTPWLISIVAALIVIYLLIQWRRRVPDGLEPEPEPPPQSEQTLDDYHDLLEDDLAG